MQQQPLWQASPERKQASNMQAFLERANSEYPLNLNSYAELHQWSVEQREAFWSLLWHYAQVEAQIPYDSVLTNGDKMPGARWFDGAKLNFAENLLAPANNPDLANKAALVFRNEDPNTRVEISYAELYLLVAKAARAMRALGVVAGDRVAAFMPNCPQTVIAMLAATSIGAVFSSCSPDFGIQGVLDRFGQIKPKLLLATQGYLYAGKKIDCGERVQAIAESLDLDAAQLISVPYVGLENEFAQPEQSMLWEDFLNNDSRDIDFEALPFDHPLYIMYSSGTTGVPKCIVHGAGGTLLQHKKELLLHTDVKADDVLFYFTTCGWMMWNWLVSGLSTGATVLLFDGSPFHQHGEANPEVMWNIAEQEGITIFGTSAKYLSALEKAGVKPAASHDHKVRTLLSTGSPLAHESFDYVYRDIAVESDGQTDLALCSISGGTDIISCFALGNPLLPVYRGELQCLGLGMDVQIWDEDGNQIQAPAAGRQEKGKKGELVCARAFPSMPVGFWNDDCSEIPYGQKYHDAYFDQFENVWAHGDYAELTQHSADRAELTQHSAEGAEVTSHGLIIHGRSDAVLNPGGVRIGTAEIYRQVEKLDEVVESLAIGQQWQDDVRVVLFVVLSQESSASDLCENGITDELRQKIRQQIRANCTPRHVPAKVIAVPELPRTISGKLVELAVRNVVHGEPVKNTDALANPQALAHFKDIEELAHD